MVNVDWNKCILHKIEENRFFILHTTLETIKLLSSCDLHVHCPCHSYKMLITQFFCIVCFLHIPNVFLLTVGVKVIDITGSEHYSGSSQ